MTKPQHTSRKGFTLVELLIVVTIAVVITLLSFLQLGSRRCRNDLNSTTQRIAALLRSTRNKAVTQINGANWGVHFENTSTPFYAAFQGSYVSRSSSTDYAALPSSLTYRMPQGASQTITFPQVTGTLTNATSVIIDSTCISGASSTITVNLNGAVSY